MVTEVCFRVVTYFVTLCSSLKDRTFREFTWGQKRKCVHLQQKCVHLQRKCVHLQQLFLLGTQKSCLKRSTTKHRNRLQVT